MLVPSPRTHDIVLRALTALCGAFESQRPIEIPRRRCVSSAATTTFVTREVWRGGTEHLCQLPKYSTPPWERCRPPVASCSTYARLSGVPLDPMRQGGIRENVAHHLFFRNQNVLRCSHVKPIKSVIKSVVVVNNYFEGERLHPTPTARGAMKSRRSQI